MVINMQKIVGVTELQRNFRAIFDEVANENTPYILTRSSRPEAVLISYEEFVQWQSMREQEVLARFDALTTRLAQQNESFSDEEVAVDVEAALDELEG